MQKEPGQKTQLFFELNPYHGTKNRHPLAAITQPVTLKVRESHPLPSALETSHA